MRIDFTGRLVDAPEIRAGFIGCGSHSFRNVYPVLRFAQVKLVAVCDLDRAKAEAFAKSFGAERAWSDYHEMLAKEKLDAVFIVVNFDETGRPRYPRLVPDVLRAGCHAWIEKPPAATCAEIDAMRAVSDETGRQVCVGFKKMFMPVVRKARELAGSPDFGRPALLSTTYRLTIPPADELKRYLAGEKVESAMWFLDLCHPVSTMVYLFGMPQTMHYVRSVTGLGVATFTYASGMVASLELTSRVSGNTGFEHYEIVSDTGRRIRIENNLRLTYHQGPPPVPGQGYGAQPDYYAGAPGEVSATWEPEFSLGQLYNKGLFIQGFYHEVQEFAQAILEERSASAGTLEQARQVTRVFEAFAEGPGRTIRLG